jgi:hypothetical protein
VLATQKVFESSFSPADAALRAQASTYQLLLQQANYWAFIQLFFWIACLSGISAVVVFLMRKAKSTGAPALH